MCVGDQARYLAAIDHPHIIKFFGSGLMPLKNGGTAFFLVVKRLSGGILSEKIGPRASPTGGQGAQGTAWSSRKLTYVDVLYYAEQLATALLYLHSGGAFEDRCVLHRDLKPDNVGFTEDGIITIFDFGLTTSIPLPPPRRQKPQAGEGRDDAAPPAQELGSSSGDEAELPLPSDAARNPLSEKGGGAGGTDSACSGAEQAIVRLPRYNMTGNTGSARYMAPEVALDQPYHESVDVYSFSMILW